MNILINASNLKAGGGLQVADSICQGLCWHLNHNFTVVLPKKLSYLESSLSNKNIEVIKYSQPLTLWHIISGRDKVLDDLVESRKIDAVLTVFGPSRWKPKCTHLCGFAMPHIVLGESPYWEQISFINLVKAKLRNWFMTRDFRKFNNLLWCENEFISARLRKKFLTKPVITINNNYNQIFDKEEEWDQSVKLPPFKGITILTIAANYPHKNIGIALPVIQEIRRTNPNINIRFVFTVSQDQYQIIPEEYQENFVFLGNVNINQCPYLYKQADIVLQPSLLECFSANYVEAMKMGVPIITTDLGFAHSLCEDAALYYNASDSISLAKSIVSLSKNKTLQNDLIEKGYKQLRKFDTSAQRLDKLIDLLEKSYNHVSI